MSSYSVLFEEKVVKTLKQISEPYKSTIYKKLSGLENYSRYTRNVRKLKGHEDGYRVRIGDYRGLFVIDTKEQTIKIYALGHRKDIYKR